MSLERLCSVCTAGRCRRRPSRRRRPIRRRCRCRPGHRVVSSAEADDHVAASGGHHPVVGGVGTIVALTPSQPAITVIVTGAAFGDVRSVKRAVGIRHRTDRVLSWRERKRAVRVEHQRPARLPAIDEPRSNLDDPRVISVRMPSTSLLGSAGDSKLPRDRLPLARWTGSIRGPCCS